MTDENRGVIMLPGVRITFAHLEKPHTPPGGTKASYGADFLLDPQNPEHAHAWGLLWQEIESMAMEKWQDMAPSVLQQINQQPKLRGYGSGNERRKKNMEVLDGYQNMYYVSAKANEQPKLMGADGRVIDPDNALAGTKKPYSGCYVNALVRIWLQDNQYGRGVRFDLAAVQFAKDGPAFGPAAIDPTGFFKPIPGAPAPVAQPGMVQPGVAQPGMVQPGVAQPGVAQPGVAQPGSTLPGNVSPPWQF